MTELAENYYIKEKLRDGRDVTLRAIKSQDKPILAEGMHHLSSMSLYYRFLIPKRELTESELAYFTEVDYFHHMALLASVKENGVSIHAGIGRYIMAKDTESFRRAELAFAVIEEYQGLGIATLLLKHLTKLARESGIKEFTAVVLPDNIKMLGVFHHSNLPMKTTYGSAGTLEIVLELK